MMNHILIKDIQLCSGFIDPAYLDYLKEWREEAIQRADVGDVAASVCQQAALIDLVLFGKLRHDWIGIMDKYLILNGVPQAYSEEYAKRLHKFTNQSQQSTIHAIYTRWWIERISGKQVDHNHYAELILKKKQSDGLFYDRDVSETILRHRMKAELTLSMAMTVEILQAANKLTPALCIELATNITAPAKCPAMGYMSMEFFRLKALQILNHHSLFPVGIEGHIKSCSEGLLYGWCDFAMKSKVDAYMGTAKRTQRDKPIHSPLIGCHVSSLLEMVGDGPDKELIKKRLFDYCSHLKEHPEDIPAFQMRDVPIKFGADKTPIEIICSSYLIKQCKSK